MAFRGLSQFVDFLEKNSELIRIAAFVNPELEITEITDRFSKQPGGGKALLFENSGTSFPILINALGSEKRMAMAFGRENLSSVEEEIMSLFKRLTSPKANLWDKLKMLPNLKEVASWMPVKSRGTGTGKCQEVVMKDPDLSQLPILKCWPADGGRFITLPSVHTVDPETGIPNVGMYRMQVFGKNLTGMHWHRHKTGAAHFEKYKALGKRMPVSVTLGGDPSYIYAATAPMPENMDEYLLAGFLRKKKVRLVKCLTNDLYIPEDVDFVIEGYVDPQEELIWEGPFGDHTGFYSLADWFPKFHVTCITHRRDAVYPATVVGIPPMEDAWIGKATERIFLSPIRLTMIPELTDMNLPFAGVAHNISIVKIKKTFPGQAVKVMHALWGAGQMMFNKILIVVDDQTSGEYPVSGIRYQVSRLNKSEIVYPKSEIINVHDYTVLSDIFRENFETGYSLHYSRGPLDILDHSSNAYAFGSKLGIDLTRPFPEEIRSGKTTTPGISTNPTVPNVLTIPNVTGFETLLENHHLPVLLLTILKDQTYTRNLLERELAELAGIEHFKAVFLFDDGAGFNDLFTLVWLLGGNLEPDRDIKVVQTPVNTSFILVDATIKTPQHDNFPRDWPNVVTMDESTIAAIDRKWPAFGLGPVISSPSLKFKTLVKGQEAIRNH
ncbi:MAG TPA: menaquinone biosynthesis decarboxylase [Prolixibacteraceae bacterium]|nr:menaquinone biosynthesis decarboxylase [Prolixibacteraceae bacterium]